MDSHKEEKKKSSVNFQKMFNSINNINSGLKNVIKSQLDIVKQNFVQKKEFSFSQVEKVNPRKLNKKKKFLDDGPINLTMENLYN